MSNSSYSCSASYADADFALSFCPQPRNKCGPTSEINFSNNVNVTQEISIDSMDDGDVCTYRIKSRGGSPSIMMDNRTQADCNNMEMKYVEYNEWNINATETTESG